MFGPASADCIILPPVKYWYHIFCRSTDNNFHLKSKQHVLANVSYLQWCNRRHKLSCNSHPRTNDATIRPENSIMLILGDCLMLVCVRGESAKPRPPPSLGKVNTGAKRVPIEAFNRKHRLIWRTFGDLSFSAPLLLYIRHWGHDGGCGDFHSRELLLGTFGWWCAQPQ